MTIEIKGIAELLRKFGAADEKVRDVLAEGMSDALVVIGENIPRYPPQRPGQKYKRTGRLGRSMGSTMGGGKAGPADIESVEIGDKYVVGKYGSRLEYAQYVIGEETQAWMHVGRWWTERKVAQKVEKKVFAVFKNAARRFIEWMKR